MNEQQFKQLLNQAYSNQAPAVLEALTLKPWLIDRANEGEGWTLLHRACQGGHVDLVRGLVGRHSDVHKRDMCGFDALMMASFYGHIPVMEFLLSRGADMTARSINGDTALGLAAMNDQSGVCERLRQESGAGEQFPACKFLISNGSDLMIKNNYGKTALDLIRQNGRIGKEERDLLRSLFAEGPHPSQVQRRKDVNWARRWPFMFVVDSHGFRRTSRILMFDPYCGSYEYAYEGSLTNGRRMVSLLNLREDSICIILSSDSLLRLIVSFL